MTPLLGYSIYWDLPILIVVVSLVYSATRFDDFGAINREALRWARRMVEFLGAIAVTLYFLSWWLNSGLGWHVLAIGGAIELVIGLVYYYFTSSK